MEKIKNSCHQKSDPWEGSCFERIFGVAEESVVKCALLADPTPTQNPGGVGSPLRVLRSVPFSLIRPLSKIQVGSDHSLRCVQVCPFG